VERFAQVIPLNMQEIFIWYFEQKGVDNPERFLGVNEQSYPSPLTPLPQGARGDAIQTLVHGEGFNPKVAQSISNNSVNPENPINQIIKLMSQTKKNFDISDVISKLKNKKSRKDK